MYTLEFYSPDGDSVREGEFESVDDAINRWYDIGSRWIFYPIGVVFTPKGRVKVAPDGYEFLQGMYRKKFETFVKEMI
jgi:hypothetical protein